MESQKRGRSRSFSSSNERRLAPNSSQVILSVWIAFTILAIISALVSVPTPVWRKVRQTIGGTPKDSEFNKHIEFRNKQWLVSWKELNGGVGPLSVKYHGTKYCATDLQFDQLRNFENVKISIGLLINDQDNSRLDGGPSWDELGISELDDRTTLLAEVREAARPEGL